MLDALRDDRLRGGVELLDERHRQQLHGEHAFQRVAEAVIFVHDRFSRVCFATTMETRLAGRRKPIGGALWSAGELTVEELCPEAAGLIRQLAARAAG
jgi:hypothetical protein